MSSELLAGMAASAMAQREEDDRRRAMFEMERERERQETIAAQQRAQQEKARKGSLWKSLAGIGGTLGGLALGGLTGGAGFAAMPALLGASIGGGIGGAVGDLASYGSGGYAGDAGGSIMQGLSPALSYYAMQSLRDKYATPGLNQPSVPTQTVSATPYLPAGVNLPRR